MFQSVASNTWEETSHGDEGTTANTRNDNKNNTRQNCSSKSKGEEQKGGDSQTSTMMERISVSLRRWFRGFVSDLSVSLSSTLVTFVCFQMFFRFYMEQKRNNNPNNSSNNDNGLTNLEKDLEHILTIRKNSAFLFLFLGAIVDRLLVGRLWNQVVVMAAGAGAGAGGIHRRWKLKHSTKKRILRVLHWTTRHLSVLVLFLFVFLTVARHHYHVNLRPLLDRYRWNDKQYTGSETYYQRACTLDDISTTNLTDLVILPKWDSTRAAENILIHGASVFPGVLDRKLADEFRNFTIEKNEGLSKDELVYVMNTYTKKQQTRWSFAFTAHDHPSVPRVLQQVASHDKLRETLELFLGPDPAMIKMQTITAKQGAVHQGWHPDVNPFSSVKSFSRNYMMHFSLFIPVQDTTPNMGATGICPGTQYCSTIDEQVQDQGCGQVLSGTGTNSHNYNKKGEDPMWFSGDAVLMNQNTFHRGWEYTLRKGEHRTIIVITFTSRPRISDGKPAPRPTFTPLPRVVSRRKQEKTEPIVYNDGITPTAVITKKSGDSTRNSSDTRTQLEANPLSMQPDRVSSLDAKNFPVQSWEDESKLVQPETRVLSLGTPLTSFGHTMQDMEDSLESMSTFLTTLRFFGLYKPPDAQWGWDYVTSMFSRISAETNKFKQEDLTIWLRAQKNLGFPYSWYVKYVVYGFVPSSIEDRGIWDIWYSRSFDKAIQFFKKLSIAFVGIYLLCSILVAATVSACSADGKVGERKRTAAATADSTKHSTPGQFYRFRFFLWSCWKLVKAFGIIVIIIGALHWKMETSPLIRDIQSGRKIRKSFPNVMSRSPTSRTAAISLVPMAGSRLITHGRGRIEFVHPDKDDVLIGTRFDSLYLRIVNSFLDYHTGNRLWRKLVRETAASNGYNFGSFRSYPDLVQDAMVNTIVGKVEGRFLLQSPEMGNFTIMTKDESRRYTRRALLTEFNSVLFGLDQSVAYMISQMRFESQLRGTSLTLITAGVLEETRAKFFGETNNKKTIKRTSNSSQICETYDLLAPSKVRLSPISFPIIRLAQLPNVPKFNKSLVAKDSKSKRKEYQASNQPRSRPKKLPPRIKKRQRKKNIPRPVRASTTNK